MRLYVSSKGEWFGTQKDAQRNAPRDWTEVEVPTSKQELIKYLSENRVGASAPTASAPVIKEVPEFTSELLAPDAASWVSWSLDTLIRGDRNEAKEMLKKGLRIQREREAMQ